MSMRNRNRAGLNSITACSTVIKVGGSLLDWAELSFRLGSFLKGLPARESEAGLGVVLIAGGGPAGDLIREMDRIHTLGDVKAHRLAIRALDLSAHILASLLPGSRVVDLPEALHSVWTRREIPILAPRRFLEEDDDLGPDPLPASWDVTTDSVAARIAVRLGATRLMLLKSVDLVATLSRSEAAALGLVDRFFPIVSREVKLVEFVAFRTPGTTRHILTP
jgi:aspartokinase-like uncharacterized kinase